MDPPCQVGSPPQNQKEEKVSPKIVSEVDPPMEKGLKNTVLVVLDGACQIRLSGLPIRIS